MNIEVKQLKDTSTGEVFVPLTHWDAIANKPEDIAKESTLLQESEAIKQAIASAKPEVDLGGVAQQTTSLQIKDKLDNLNVDSEDARMVAQFFGLPAALPEGYEFMTPEEICAELEEIMTSMDLGLTQEMAATITNNTLNEQ